MSKTVADIREERIKEYKTENNTYDDFPVGTKVKIITPCEDFYFWYGETGIVIKNKHSYLGIIVKLDEPRHFEDGYIQKEFNFEPKSLVVLDKQGLREKNQTYCPHCGKCLKVRL